MAIGVAAPRITEMQARLASRRNRTRSPRVLIAEGAASLGYRPAFRASGEFENRHSAVNSHAGVCNEAHGGAQSTTCPFFLWIERKVPNFLYRSGVGAAGEGAISVMGPRRLDPAEAPGTRRFCEALDGINVTGPEPTAAGRTSSCRRRP